jgi:hypothetical protein
MTTMTSAENRAAHDAEMYDRFVGNLPPSADVAETVQREYTAEHITHMFPDWHGDESDAYAIRVMICRHVAKVLSAQVKPFTGYDPEDERNEFDPSEDADTMQAAYEAKLVEDLQALVAGDLDPEEFQGEHTPKQIMSFQEAGVLTNDAGFRFQWAGKMVFVTVQIQGGN